MQARPAWINYSLWFAKFWDEPDSDHLPLSNNIQQPKYNYKYLFKQVNKFFYIVRCGFTVD